MPPNQDTPNNSSSLPTLPQNPTPSPQHMLPEQINAQQEPSATNLPSQPPVLAPEIGIPNNPAAPIITNTPTSTPPPVNSPAGNSYMVRNITAFFIVTILLVSIGSFALAYNNYPFFKPPEAIKKTLDSVIAAAPIPKPTRIILESTIAQSSKLKSADQKTEFSISTNAKNFPVSSAKLGISGPVEFQNPDSQTAEADVNFEVKFEGAAFTGSATIQKVNDTIYFKVNEIPFGQLYQKLLDYKGKWYFYKIPAEYLPKENNQEVNTRVVKILTDFFDKSQDWTKVTNQDGDAYTLEISPPKKALDNLMFDLIAAVEPKDQKQILTDVEKENFAKQTEKIKNLKITAKVNKSNYYLRSAAITFDINEDNFSLPSTGTTLPSNEPVVLNVNITTELSNYNKKVVIVPPEGAVNIEEVIKETSAKYLNNLPQDQLEAPQESTPSPQLNLSPDNKQSGVRDLITPSETVLGQKTGWEIQTFQLFSQLFK